MPDQKTAQREQGAISGHTSFVAKTGPPDQNEIHADSRPPVGENKADTPSQNKQNRWVVGLTALIFLVTCVYSYFSWGQWSSMEKALGETKRNRELEYRAYVGTKGIVCPVRADNPAWCDVIVISTNSGRTPGLSGKFKYAIEHRETPPPDDTILNQPDLPGSKIVFAPLTDTQTTIGLIGTRMADTLVSPPSGPTMEREPKKKTPGAPAPVVPSLIPPQSLHFSSGYYVFGVIEYNDIFGKQHWTKFCYFNTPGTSGWINCPTFNDAQ